MLTKYVGGESILYCLTHPQKEMCTYAITDRAEWIWKHSWTPMKSKEYH